MRFFLWWGIPVLAVVAAVELVRRRRARATRRRAIQASWGRPVLRERDMVAVSAYQAATVAEDASAEAIDDQSWRDLDMDAVFAVLDRTGSRIGQQVLYARLRACTGDDLSAFEGLATFASQEVESRVDLQASLAGLEARSAYDLWNLAMPGAIRAEWWFALFPLLTGLMLSAIIATVFTPAALLIVIGTALASIAIRTQLGSRLQLLLGPLRQLGPLLSTAERVAALQVAGAEPVIGELPACLSRLSRLRRMAAWIARDTEAGAFGDLAGLAAEYLNLVFFVDANILLFAAGELRSRGGDLLRVIHAVGTVDAAISVASYRAGVEGWTRPTFESGAVALVDLRHPLVAEAVPNSIRAELPAGLIVTGSNMSGKSTFLKAAGVSAVMAQSLNTCLATTYRAPHFVVRARLRAADDIATGRSYYMVEVQSVLELVHASRLARSHLFLLDELFRGTNAVERIAAGEAVLCELISGPRHHLALAATHDRELVDLLVGSYAAFHFTDAIGPDGLMFDYRLVPGPATTRNAIAVLEMSGAPEGMVRRALERSAELDRARRISTTHDR